MRMQPWIGVLVVVTVALPLAACKSRTRRAPANDAYGVPATASQAQPAVGDIVDGEVWAGGATADGTSGSPDGQAYVPAPMVPSDPAITQGDLDDANFRADEADRKRAAAEAQIRADRDRLAANDAELARIRRELDDLGNAPTDPITEAPVLSSASDIERLVEDLQASTNADVIRDGNLVIVRMTNSFQAGSDRLKKDAALITTINATANALSSHPGASVSVVGHSDTDPINVTKNKWRDNGQLSLARAQRVASVLASSGVDSNRISIDGRGAREPLIAPERSRADKARNRRVEIMIRL